LCMCAGILIESPDESFRGSRHSTQTRGDCQREGELPALEWW